MTKTTICLTNSKSKSGIRNLRKDCVISLKVNSLLKMFI